MAMKRSRPQIVSGGRWWPLIRSPGGRDIVAPVPARTIGVVGWIAALALATIGMLFVRDRLNEAHVALVYLLVVLGSSAYGGRTFGLTVAATAFMLFDWFF